MSEPEKQPGTDSAREQMRPAPVFAAATQPSYARTLFFGSDGLRPGWGLIFYFTAYYLLRRAAETFSYPRSVGALRVELLDECALLIAALLPSLVLARIEHRPWQAYGFALRNAFGKLFWIGTAWGIAALSLLMCTLSGIHAFAFGHVVLRGLRIERFALFWALMFVVVALFEEFFFRGYAQFTLARGVRFWPAAIALSCCFGILHLGNEGEQWRGAVAAACIGLFLCLTLRRTGNLWFAVGFHAAWDWGESFLYSVPDSGMKSPGHLLSSSLHGPAWLSGGSVGPEGSVVCFLVIAVTWAVFAWRYPRMVYRLPEVVTPSE